jgi:hypothetical protein
MLNEVEGKGKSHDVSNTFVALEDIDSEVEVLGKQLHRI